MTKEIQDNIEEVLTPFEKQFLDVLTYNEVTPIEAYKQLAPGISEYLAERESKRILGIKESQDYIDIKKEQIKNDAIIKQLRDKIPNIALPFR